MHLSQFYNTINQENEFRFRLPMGKLINDLGDIEYKVKAGRGGGKYGCDLCSVEERVADII